MPVPSLVDLSTQMIIRNIQALDDVSDISYDRIRHILRNIHNPAQLRRIELASPQIIGEDKELWLEFLKRDVPDYVERLRAMGKIKSWHETYFTLLEETEARVAEDTEKLRKAMLGAANEKASHTSKLVNPSALPNLHKHTRIGPTGASRSIAAPSSGPKGSIFLEKARKDIRQMRIFGHRNATARTQVRPTTAAAAAATPSSASSLSPPRPAPPSSSFSVSSSTSGRFGGTPQPGQAANGRFGRIGRIGRLGGSSSSSGMPLPKALLSAADMRRLTLSATSTATAAPAAPAVAAAPAAPAAAPGDIARSATTTTSTAAAAGQQPRKKRPASPQPPSAMGQPAYIPPRLVSRAATASATNPLMPSRQQQQQRRRPASGLPAASSAASPPLPSASSRLSSSSSSSALPPSRTRASVPPSAAKRQRVA